MRQHRLLQSKRSEGRRRRSGCFRVTRPDEVWQFMTPADVAEVWPAVEGKLGRRRPFWEWLLSSWRALGLLA